MAKGTKRFARHGDIYIVWDEFVFWADDNEEQLKGTLNVIAKLAESKDTNASKGKRASKDKDAAKEDASESVLYTTKELLQMYNDICARVGYPDGGDGGEEDDKQVELSEEESRVFELLKGWSKNVPVYEEKKAGTYKEPWWT